MKYPNYVLIRWAGIALLAVAAVFFGLLAVMLPQETAEEAAGYFLGLSLANFNAIIALGFLFWAVKDAIKHAKLMRRAHLKT